MKEVFMVLLRQGVVRGQSEGQFNYDAFIKDAGCEPSGVYGTFDLRLFYCVLAEDDIDTEVISRYPVIEHVQRMNSPQGSF